MNTHDTIGSYLLLSALGEGGMGVVYVAEHKQTKQRVALKTVRVPKASLLGSIRREIQALERLRHPGIVRILDEGLHDGLPWYAMEILEGQELRQWMSQPLDDHLTTEHTLSERPLDSIHATAHGNPWQRTLGDSPLSEEVDSPSTVTPRALEEILDVAYRLCAPLAFLHGEGLLHKDLKPENVLVRPDGTVVLLDFGLATRSGGESSREILAVEVGITGTAYYMSPEQIEDETLDARTDLYSFGVILYELLTGQKPFVGENIHQIIMAHLTETPPPPSALMPNIPPELDALVLRLLSKNRRERPGYASDVALALGGERGTGYRRGTAAMAYHRQEEAQNNAPIRNPQTVPRSLFPVPHPSRPYLYRPSFSGRQEQLSLLREYVGQAEKGEGGLVLLGGESGVGKTRLVVEIAREAARRGKAVVSGDCHDVVSRRALSVLQRPLQKIGDYCRERGREHTDRIFGQRGKLLSLYEPSLVSLPGQDSFSEPAELPVDAARLRLFTAIGEVLTLYSKDATRSGVLLLVLDDLQWADELSLGFLQFFLQSQNLSQSLLVLGTYRSEEVSEALASLSAHKKTKRVEVGRLEEKVVAELVGEMLAMTPPPALFSRFLSKHSEGNPFFVAEYLRAAVEEGLLWRDKEGRWQIGDSPESNYESLSLPRSLRALIERRLSGLSMQAKAAAEVAALLGREFSTALWECLSPDVLILDELLKRQVLEEASPGVLRFVHDKLREGFVTRIEAARLPRLHRIAAQSIEEIRKWGEHLAALGYHWEQAGESDKAADYYLAGARRAAGAYSYEESERLYRAYLQLIPTPTEMSITARNELGEKVLLPLGALDAAGKEHTLAVEEAQAAKLLPLAMQGLRLVGVVYWKKGLPEEARPFFERALLLSRELSDPRAEGICLRHLGILRYDQGKSEEARVLYTRALELQRFAGDRSQEGLCLGSLAILEHDNGRLEEAQSLHERALYLARLVGDHRFEGICLNNLSALSAQQGKMREAMPLFEQALHLARVVGDRRSEGISLSQLASLHHMQDNVPEAQPLYEKALVIHRDVGNRRSEGICLSNLANLLREQGQMLASRPLYEQALVIHQEMGNRRFIGVCLDGLAEQERWERGDIEAARAHCEEAEDLFAEVGDQAALGKALCLKGSLWLWGGRSARALIERIRNLDIASKEAELRSQLSQLEQAQAAFDASQTSLLFRGELIENIPAPVRHWLTETNQLL